MILSIDVGIRNLAMCLLNETSNLVEEWDVSGVPPEHKDGIYVSLRKHLDEKTLGSYCPNNPHRKATRS